MKLQDYIHYYIGCPCIYYMADDDPEGYHMPLDYDIIKRWLADQDETDIKLILRKLEDMTEDDWRKVTSETKLSHDTISMESLKDSFIHGGFDDRYHWTVVNHSLISLRKIGVDVDGLIDAGLALDAKTIQ